MTANIALQKNMEQKLNYTDRVGEYTHAPEPNQVTCVHCGQKFFNTDAKGSALQKMRIHLRWCGKRVLLRHLKYNGYIFVIAYNPTKRLFLSLNEFARDADTREFPQLLIGALKFLKISNGIKNFSPFEVKNSPDFLRLENGITPYKTIRTALSPEDRDSFGVFANSVYERRFEKEV